MPHHFADPTSTDIGAIALSPVLWACAVAVFAVIAVQSLIYLRAIRKAAVAADLTPAQVTTSVRTGAITAIGPSLAVVLVAISLLPLFGTPAVLTRIGLIGSAGYEVAAAGIASATAGAQLGGPDYTQRVFAIALFAMTAGGIVWMLATLVFTPILARGDTSLRKVNPAIMTIVPGAALLGAFATLGLNEMTKSPVHIITMLTSTAVMGVCLLLARRFGAGWLREWGLGFAVIIALGVAAVTSGTF